MFILKKVHQPGVYVPLRALFLVTLICTLDTFWKDNAFYADICICEFFV